MGKSGLRIYIFTKKIFPRRERELTYYSSDICGVIRRTSSDIICDPRNYIFFSFSRALSPNHYFIFCPVNPVMYIDTIERINIIFRRAALSLSLYRTHVVMTVVAMYREERAEREKEEEKETEINTAIHRLPCRNRSIPRRAKLRRQV